MIDAFSFEKERDCNVPCSVKVCDYQGDPRFDAYCDVDLHRTCDRYWPEYKLGDFPGTKPENINPGKSRYEILKESKKLV
jgi:hypothetical protein